MRFVHIELLSESFILPIQHASQCHVYISISMDSH